MSTTPAPRSVGVARKTSSSPGGRSRATRSKGTPADASSPGVSQASKGLRAATPPWGTQSIHRAVTMLREIAAYRQGVRLVDLAAAMDLERPTAHRIVKGLMAQGMVMQDPQTKVYRLGHVVYELGLAATPYYNLKEICEPALQRIAKLTGDAVYLMVRSGFDCVCIDHIEGSYPIRTRTMEVGTRRPLGIGAASVALMLGMSEREIEQAITLNAPRLTQFGTATPARLREVLARSRRAGYAINEEDVLPGVGGIGVPLPTRSGQAYASISVAGIISRFDHQRREALAPVLFKEARGLAKKLDELSVRWD